MTRSPIILLALVSGGAGFAAGPSRAQWAHVGNTYNSAVFVDRAVLAESGANRRFRTLHINVQLSAGWRAAEHRGTIDCAAQTLRYEAVVMTKADGRRETLPSAVTKPVPFPPRGVLRMFATSVCAGKLGPAVGDPEAWTRKNFQPG